MYTSSDGTKKNVKDMNYEHIVNAFAKLSREIFQSESLEEYNTKINNMTVLENEIFERLDNFLTTKLDEEGWKI